MRPAEAPGAVLLQHHVLALVGLPVGRLGGVGIGQVLGGHVHADTLRGQPAAGDADRFEQTHQVTPIAERMMLSRASSTCVSA